MEIPTPASVKGPLVKFHVYMTEPLAPPGVTLTSISCKGLPPTVITWLAPTALAPITAVRLGKVGELLQLPYAATALDTGTGRVMFAEKYVRR